MEVTEQLEEYGFEGCPIIKGSALKAVSYTHLDVYKRQECYHR